MGDMLHFKYGVANPYLAASDLAADENTYSEETLTIEDIYVEKNRFEKKNAAGNVADWIVIKFTEQKLSSGLDAKPMVLGSAVNRKALWRIGSSADLKKCIGKSVTLYVETGLTGRVGGTEGLRIKEAKQKKQLPSGGELYTKAVAAYKRDGNLDAVKKHYEVNETIEQAIKNEA